MSYKRFFFFADDFHHQRFSSFALRENFLLLRLRDEFSTRVLRFFSIFKAFFFYCDRICIDVCLCLECAAVDSLQLLVLCSSTSAWCRSLWWTAEKAARRRFWACVMSSNRWLSQSSFLSSVFLCLSAFVACDLVNWFVMQWRTISRRHLDAQSTSTWSILISYSHSA